MAVLLALGVGIDQYAFDGKYTAVAQKLTYALLHRL
jgi:hypothetical protein